MIKQHILKLALIFFCSAFLFLGVYATAVSADTLYTLTNDTTNGSFESGWTDWTRANGTDNYYLNTDYKTTGIQSAEIDIESGNTKFVYRYIEGDTAHKYYVSVDIIKLGGSGALFAVLPYGVQSGAIGTLCSATQFDALTVETWTKFSGIFTSTNDGISLLFGRNGSIYTYNIAVDSVIVIDLTLQFGEGFEPSLSDFETIYLPDLDYFDEYSSFRPDNYITVDFDDYLDLDEDLTSLDYTTSVISNYGKNVVVNCYAYFYDVAVSGDGEMSAFYYSLYNNPELLYMGQTDVLSWSVSDYSSRVIELEMTASQNETLKRILFGRQIDKENEYFMIRVEPDYFKYVKVFFTISSVFDLNVNIQSFLVSLKSSNPPETPYWDHHDVFLTLFDQDDNILYPSLHGLMTNYELTEFEKTVLLDDFGTAYTNVKRFDIGLELKSPDIDWDFEYQDYFFYELGVFSSDDVYIPVVIDTDVGNLFENQVCEWYQVGCQLTNLANNTGALIYNGLHIEEIQETFNGFFDTVGDIVAILPSELVVICLVILGSVGVGVIFIIVEWGKGS